MAKAVGQKVYGNVALIIFLALLSAFVPLSTDLYLPALPAMSRVFHVPEFTMNLTLVLFFIFFSIATLIWGPLSDKFGRRPILLVGMLIYMIGGMLCAISQSAGEMIFFRMIQATGAGTATTIATAIIKDVFVGKKQENTLAIVQSMVVISPAIAPVIGAWLLTHFSWRGIFWVQASLGLLLLGGSFLFTETRPLTANIVGVKESFKRMGAVLKNPAFTRLLIIFSLMSIVSLAYISSSSYIFQNFFHLSSQRYSLFFSFNALGMLVAPLLYIWVSRFMSRVQFIYIAFSFSILGGLLILLFGFQGAIPFALAQMPATLAASGIRPAGTYLVLKQHDRDNGAAASLYSAAATIMGSGGMILVALFNQNPVLTLAIVNIAVGLFCLLAFMITWRALRSQIVQ